VAPTEYICDSKLFIKNIRNIQMFCVREVLPIIRRVSRQYNKKGLIFDFFMKFIVPAQPKSVVKKSQVG
jgi:hypothetical protein